MKTLRILLLSVIVSITSLMAENQHTTYHPYALGGYGYFAWGYNNPANNSMCRIYVTGNDSGGEPKDSYVEAYMWAYDMAYIYDGYYACGDGNTLFESGAA